MIKRVMTYIGGFAAYIVPPLVYVGFKHDMLVSTDAGVSLSAFGVVGIIAALPVLRYFFKNLPVKVNWVGVTMLVVGLLARYLGDFLMWVGVWSTAGGIAGDLAFKAAEKMKVTTERETLAKTVAKELQAGKINV